MEKKFVAIGDSTPLGGKILKVRTGHAPHLQVVLAELANNEPRFVTWVYNISAPGFNSGHYVNELAVAERDFTSR